MRALRATQLSLSGAVPGCVMVWKATRGEGEEDRRMEMTVGVGKGRSRVRRALPSTQISLVVKWGKRRVDWILEMDSICCAFLALVQLKNDATIIAEWKL